jgi:hypothetical protein
VFGEYENAGVLCYTYLLIDSSNGRIGLWLLGRIVRKRAGLRFGRRARKHEHSPGLPQTAPGP